MEVSKWNRGYGSLEFRLRKGKPGSGIWPCADTVRCDFWRRITKLLLPSSCSLAPACQIRLTISFLFSVCFPFSLLHIAVPEIGMPKEVGNGAPGCMCEASLMMSNEHYILWQMFQSQCPRFYQESTFAPELLWRVARRLDRVCQPPCSHLRDFSFARGPVIWEYGLKNV